MISKDSWHRELTIFDYWNIILKRRFYIGISVVLTSIIVAIISLFLTEFYKTKAVILPLEGESGISSLMSSMGGGLASLVGIGTGGSKNQRLLALLNSRTLAERVIDKYNLMELIFDKGSYEEEVLDPKNKMEVAINGLMGAVKINEDKLKGIIEIEVELEDPKLAAEVANGYLKELQKFINESLFTVAKRNRVFIEEQLFENKRELLVAGKELNEFYKVGKVSSVDSKMDVFIDNNINLRMPVDIDGIKGIGQDIKELQIQKDSIEKDIHIVKNVPQQVYLQYLTLRRNLLAQINTLITQQYEMAKIKEAKDEIAFQVIDAAITPEKRSRPKRRQMVMVAFFSTFALACFISFFLEYIGWLKKNRQSS